MPIIEHQSLKNYNTFGVEATARYFAKAQSIAELLEILNEYIEIQRKEKLKPILFLGGGSNILFTKNYDGLVIYLNLKGIKEVKKSEDVVMISAMAGENWHKFVRYCLSKNYGGLENLSLIPGNVGTCPIQNIGAYGVEIKDYFYECSVLNFNTLQIEKLNLNDCKFGYRDSVFKSSKKGIYAILEVSFNLKTKNHQLNTSYGSINQELKTMNVLNPSINDVSNAVVNIRTSKLPDPKLIGNAGSFFKNPIIPIVHFNTLQLKYPKLEGYPTKQGIKVPAGWLIENTGWKGKQLGNAATYHLQALVIINKTGNATGQEIFDFSQKIIDSVQEKFQIQLEREINII